MMRLRSLKSFNPRPRRGGDRRHPQGGLRCSSFQSTPPQGGRPERSQRRRRKRQVSIHAPAGGATVLRWPKSPGWSCFNPRPRRGGDLHPDKLDEPFHWFQSTPPQGGDPSPNQLPQTSASFNPRPRRGGDYTDTPTGVQTNVSIHAPAGGATYPYSCASCRCCCFNPRPRRGGDLHTLQKQCR